jgi:hypothetical protein
LWRGVKYTVVPHIKEIKDNNVHDIYVKHCAAFSSSSSLAVGHTKLKISPRLTRLGAGGGGALGKSFGEGIVRIALRQEGDNVRVGN